MDVGGLHDAAGLAPQHRRVDDPAVEVAELAADASIAPFVARNQPCVLRGALSHWPPVQLWDDKHLRAQCGERRVPVREADASGSGVFGSPNRPGVYARDGARDAAELRLADLLDQLARSSSRCEPAGVYAAQVRLRTCLPELFAETRPEPACLAALGPRWRNSPSMYFGYRARTRLHHDLYENVLCVVRGRKSVCLWHPAHAPLLYPGGGGSALFSLVDDPLLPTAEYPLLADAAPLALRVTLRAGDALYLPCCWWHDVRSGGEGGASLSVSYWCEQPAEKVWRPPPPCDGAGDHLWKVSGDS